MIYFLKGLPASGKSTWAKAKLQDLGGRAVHCNKDNIRVANPHWSEKRVVAEEVKRVKDGLHMGYHIILDNTHFNPVHETRYREIAREFGDLFTVVDHFLDVPLEECIRRDNKRPNGVGESVIKGMWRKYIRGENPPVESIGLQKICLIVDIDGTIADHRSVRDVYDHSKVSLDKPRWNHIRVVEILSSSVNHVFFLSGRDEKVKPLSSDWIEKQLYLHAPYSIIHRPEGDNRKDYVYKKEAYEEQIKAEGYSVLAIFEDRPRIIRMWQSLGLPVFSCNEDYDHDF